MARGPAYFWGIWLPLVFINVYMLVWIVLRQTIMIANIQRLLRLFAVEPVPFHPDRCSGFAPSAATPPTLSASPSSSAAGRCSSCCQDH